MKSAAEFYDDAYFERYLAQKSILGPANLFKFADYIAPNSKVVDFGCGGGFLLQSISAAEKIGVEINPVARDCARSLGLQNIYADLSAVPDGWADVVISNHAMEHVEDPAAKLREFHRVLKPSGRIVVVTPYDSVRKKFSEDDRDFHLFSWNPATAGNLAKACGFKVIEASEIIHRWPPGSETIWNQFGARVFHLACRLYGLARRGGTQVRVVAERLDG